MYTHTHTRVFCFLLSESPVRFFFSFFSFLLSESPGSNDRIVRFHRLRGRERGRERERGGGREGARESARAR